MSDTHGRKDTVKRIILSNKDVDVIIHLGDGVSDINDEGLDKKLILVKGNCDIRSDVPTERTVTIGNTRILLTHGHRYHVKFSMDRLIYRAMEEEVSAAFYGHTHVPCETFESGIMLFNPGSLCRPLNGQASYSIATVDNGRIFIKTILI